MDPETWKTVLVFLQHGCSEQPFPNARLETELPGADQNLTQIPYTEGINLRPGEVGC